MKNPFTYGCIVTGKDFADRKDELRNLSRDLIDCEKIFLISPRRYGKSSLIANILNNLKKAGLYTIYIDLYKATSLNKFLELYSREVALSVENKAEKAVRLIKEFLPGLRPKITVDGEGNAGIGIDYINSKRDVLKLLDEIYDLPQKLAAKKKKNFVIAFDEFQEISSYNGDSIEKSMRAYIQNHKNVGYLFAGSKKHILTDMVRNRNRAFYKIGKTINLNKIPVELFSAFLKEKFAATGFKLEAGVMNNIINRADNYPYNVQYLCHELWDMNRDKQQLKNSDIEIALYKILSEETPFYSTIWDGLTHHQRNVLQALAVYGGEKIFSHEFISAGGIGPSSTLQTSVKLLVKKDILEKENGKYTLADIFFREWVKRKTI